ncbi:MAG: transposase [Pseudomonadota bacterium]
MVRPLRIEFPGALYHVTCRGNRRESIFRDRMDRHAWLDETADVCRRFHFVIHAYCQMTNHFHVLVETPEGNLGQGMRQWNSAYAQYYNRRHGLVGHVMQGRYHALLVQRDAYLRELARYIVLNPVRARMVARPDEWEWSSYRAMLAEPVARAWLETTSLLASFGADPVMARQAYVSYVAEGMDGKSPFESVSFQCLLGDDAFVAQHRSLARTMVTGETARAQRRILARSLDEYAAQLAPREVAMAAAYHSTVFSMGQIATHFGVSVKTVSRAIAAVEGQAKRKR